MPKYHHLDKSIDWRNFIPKIEPNVISFLLKDDNNFILAWGIESEFHPKHFSFKDFQDYKNEHSSRYIFGFFGYDLKNKIETNLVSNNLDELEFPDCYFFTAKNVLINTNGQLTFSGHLTFNEINQLIDKPSIKYNGGKPTVSLSPAISKNDYLNKVDRIKSYLHRGDLYELNYCQTFNGTFQTIDSFSTFLSLKSRSDAPFSSYFSFNDFSILSLSPERFLNKIKQKLISQPIKGTAPRSPFGEK